MPLQKWRELLELVDEAGLFTRKDIISFGLTILLWAVQETKKGRVIAAIDEKNNSYHTIASPSIQELLAKHSPQVSSDK